MPRACMVSFRLGGADGVSIETKKWADALMALGWDVYSVAGAGDVDVLVPGLAIGAPDAPTRAEVDDALAGADLVVIENLCSLPLNPAAAAQVATACAGRPAVLHHHDLAWQRPHLAHHPGPPDDPAWAHVTINELSRRELHARGIRATTVYNMFDPSPQPGERAGTRAALGVADDSRLLLQPTRALPRKNVAGGLAVAEAVSGVYWLLGPAEDGYGPELERLVEGARCPVLLGSPSPSSSSSPSSSPPPALPIADAYAACDGVLLPSTWEGFGNPSIESAAFRKPLAIGPYPVAAELAAFGFEWFTISAPAPLASWLTAPDEAMLDRNHRVVAEHFDLADLPARLAQVLRQVPGLPASV